MKTLMIYYSYSGKTKRIALALAEQQGADTAEVKDAKRPGKLKAYLAGSVAALRGKAWAIQPLSVDMTAYDHLILLAPVWASSPAPPFNAMIHLLPSGKTVDVKMVSMSGKSNCKERVEAAIKAKNCTMERFEDLKS